MFFAKSGIVVESEVRGGCENGSNAGKGVKLVE